MPSLSTLILPLTTLLTLPASSAPTPSSNTSTPTPSLPPLITLEEHFASQAFIRANLSSDLGLEYFPPSEATALQDLSTGRLASLNANNIALQIISHTPSFHVPPASLCTAANNELAAAIAAHPTRFAGFATLPVLDPPAAAAELARCVKQLGFVGALIPHHANGRYYDDAFFRPLFAEAQALDVPVYLHPTWAADDQTAHYAGNYTDGVELALANYGYGWHADAALGFLRAWAGGLFDAFPRLKVILGHDGEGVPFWLGKIEPFLDQVRLGGQRSLNDTWAENVWVTTSGQFEIGPLQSVLGRTDPGRIMFSVDYPIATNEEGVEFMRTLQGSGVVSKEELEGIANGNARELLGVKLPA